MNNTDNNDKLEWMYKGANSQVDREEYLLGKTVDKSFEQLNNEEKEKKLGLVPPKNHVEHECIPPSIRDYNRIIVHQEQVDLFAKLQEDPLIAIKKQEDEARRQFLQNPIQLKKLQDALKAQESKKQKKKDKKKHSDSEDDLDKQIREKLKKIKGSSLARSLTQKDKKDSKERHLDTILMHKYNNLKDKLSQKDLDDILAGRSSSDSDGEEESEKIKKESDESSYDSDVPRKKPRLENTRNKVVKKDKYSKFKNDKRSYTKERDSSVSSSSDSKEKRIPSKYMEKKRYQESRRREDQAGGSTDYRKGNNSRGYRESRRESPSERSYRKDKKDVESSRKKDSESCDDSRKKIKDKKYREKRESGSEDRRKASRSTRNDRSRSRSEERKKLKKAEQKDSRKTDQDLDTLILQKLRMLRDSKTDKYEQKEDTPEKEYARYDSDNDDYVVRKKSFGLVRSDGTKIPLKDPIPATTRTVKKVPVKPVEVKRIGTKLSDKEKEELRRQMMTDAVKRDKERSDNLRKHREENEREEKMDDFDKNFVHKELSKSHSNIKSVETRIRSKLNNIQRSSQHMNSNFAKRS